MRFPGTNAPDGELFLSPAVLTDCGIASAESQMSGSGHWGNVLSLGASGLGRSEVTR
ncbi:hypothetical protein JK203_15410 [Gluconobacter cerinus]|uniref:hypothetical protein n=1 Tax=Gluconobacter cerinus TaxID=38307 RepID=UPI001B8B9398|nr:hypothetical protein [Gluconobacter cerinus]MBS1042207.1 hypothetical protein [Gluconobacter cerinus]MBS1048754.1 hypothetical protein [Gluconobacter cerinus]